MEKILDFAEFAWGAFKKIPGNNPEEKFRFLQFLRQKDENFFDRIREKAFVAHNSSDYRTATRFYRFLERLDALTPEDAFNMADSLYRMSKYELAIRYYNKSSLADASNPLPVFHAADCYLHLQDWCSAKENFEATIRRGQNSEKYRELVLEAQSLLKQLIQGHPEVLNKEFCASSVHADFRKYLDAIDRSELDNI